MNVGLLVVVMVMVVLVVKCGDAIMVDLSYDIGNNTQYWPGMKPYTRTPTYNGYHEQGFWLEYYDICMNEHTSTHMDAPAHFAKGMWTVDQIPLSHLVAPGVVVDIQEKVKADPLAMLSREDLEAWQDKHGPLPDGVIVLVRTGWAKRYDNQTAYFGTNSNNMYNMVIPGISLEAAQFLTNYDRVHNRKVVGVGVDGPSLDGGKNIATFPVHVELCSNNVYGLENIGELSALPEKGFQLIVMPVKFQAGTGGPARIVANIPDFPTHNSAPTTLPYWPLFLLVLIML